MQKILFPNRPFSEYERSKLSPFELEVVLSFEQTTGLVFMRYDLPLLKKCIRHATPASIIQLIKKYYRDYPDNFTNFNYIVEPIISNGVLSKSRGEK